MFDRALSQEQSNFKNYSIGQKEYRPWGYFEVTDVGRSDNEEFCEKEIVMLPHKAMSVQRHALRRENWEIIEGTLTVILNGELHTLHVGEGIAIPLRAVHCMINLSSEKVVIRERQMGICREADNDRLSDMNGRDVKSLEANDLNALESVELYKRLVKNL